MEFFHRKDAFVDSGYLDLVFSIAADYFTYLSKVSIYFFSISKMEQYFHPPFVCLNTSSLSFYTP